MNLLVETPPNDEKQQLPRVPDSSLVPRVNNGDPNDEKQQQMNQFKYIVPIFRPAMQDFFRAVLL